MKRGVWIILMMWGIQKSFCQTISHLEPRMLAYDRKRIDAGMGNALVAHAAYASKPSFGLHLENHYSIQQANALSIALVLPTKKNALTTGLYTEGMNSFRNWSVNLGYALQLQKDMSVGLKLFTTGTQIKNNKALISIGYQLGMTYKLSDATQCHLHFSNSRPLNASFNDNIQGIFQIHAGMAQQINSDLLVSCDFDQTKGSSISISPGMAWSIQNEIQLLAGVKPLPGEAFIGIGWTKTNNRLIILISHHPYLGNSFAIRYILEKK